jgi:hypothetical protein
MTKLEKQHIQQGVIIIKIKLYHAAIISFDVLFYLNYNY